jgi:hypothetical protein
MSKELKTSIYRTAKGREIDMIRLMNQNEMTVAVGNANVNARGDKLGPDGKIVKRREEILAEKNIPEQINVRQQDPAPVTPTAETKAVPVVTKKDISDQDPEGTE